jgi:hypothetical protein
MARQKGLPTGRCQGCNHPERVRIERFLAASAPIKRAARKFAINSPGQPGLWLAISESYHGSEPSILTRSHAGR